MNTWKQNRQEEFLEKQDLPHQTPDREKNNKCKDLAKAKSEAIEGSFKKCLSVVIQLLP